ncbi:AAA family ATPase [Patescibacteria group bacterium]|nr:AAA family ATPase [Patescibacteria group bacterium]
MNNNEKLPPQNLEAEKSLLGCVLIDKNSIKKITGLSDKDFYNDKNAEIFKNMQEMHADSEPIDIVSLTNKLEGKKQLESIGGRTYLAQLASTAGLNSNISQYAKIIKEKSSMRKLREIGQRIENLSGEDNPTESIKEAKKLVDDLQIKKENDFKVVNSDEILEAKISDQPFIIDRLIPEKAITSITADSGKGKSILSIILARYIAKGEKLFGEFNVKQGKVLVVDQEMNKNEIFSRHQSIIKGEKGLKIDYLGEQFLQIDNKSDYEWLKNRIKEKNYRVVIFDTLTNLHAKNENSADEMKEINKLLLNLIYKTGTTIVYLHHHRKRQQGEYYSQSSSRGSTEIIAKTASHLLIDSKQFTENEITITEMTIQQEKARSSKRINKIGLKIFYDYHLKETHWEYLGEINDAANKLEMAKKFVLDILEKNGEHTINGFKAEKEKQGLNFGINALRSVCKDLITEGLITSRNGEGSQWRTQHYSLS